MASHGHMDINDGFSSSPYQRRNNGWATQIWSAPGPLGLQVRMNRAAAAQRWRRQRGGWKCFSKCLKETLHYWLRRSIGFLNVQKKSTSRRLFLTQGTLKTDNFALFVKIMTQILCKIIFSLC